MEKPQIKWYYYDSTTEEYKMDTEAYIGSCSSDKPISITLQLWNNRYGTETVESLKNFYVEMSFEEAEDNYLLDYCTVSSIKERLELTINKDGATILIPENTVISGENNNGSSEDYPDNCFLLNFLFEIPSNMKIKENDLKTLCLSIIEI